MPIESLSATVTLKAQAQTQKGDPYWKLDLMPDGADRAQTWTMFAHDVAFEQGAPINVGERWEFGVEESPKEGGGGIWRNIKGVVKRLDAATPQSVAKAKTAPSESNEQAVAKARSSALHGAISLAVGRMGMGVEVKTTDVMRIADALCLWQGVQPYTAPQETAPDDRSDEEWPEPVEESAAMENERLYG